MAEHPIQGLMITAMENLRGDDVNKIVGDVVETPDGHVIIQFQSIIGFVAGGMSLMFWKNNKRSSSESNQNQNQNIINRLVFLLRRRRGVSISR